MWKTTTILISIVLIFLTLGVVMLASTSGALGQSHHGDPHFFLKRQLLWLAIGVVFGVVAAAMDYHTWRILAIPLAVFSIALLVLTVLPGVGLNIKGSSRWLRLGSISLQPSEIAKFSSIVLVSWWMARVQSRAEEFKPGLLIPLMALSVYLVLILIEPDFGTTMLLALVGMILMYVGGARLGYLVITGLLGLSGFSIAIMQNPERMRRIVAFSDPEKYAQNESFQLLNAIYAFVVGRGTGVGLGQSLQKHFYLPEAHTDFIFAIVGEELGLAASLFVVVLYLTLFICGLRISLLAQEKFGKLLGLGITLIISIQAAINIGVVTGSLPTKGLPLPFISFGGSSLVMSLLMIGVLVNIARQAGEDFKSERSRFIKDRAHRL